MRKATTTKHFFQRKGVKPRKHKTLRTNVAGGIERIGLFAGIFFGIFTSLLGDFMEHTFNSYCDSHIDPPALTIFTTTFLILLLFG